MFARRLFVAFIAVVAMPAAISSVLLGAERTPTVAAQTAESDEFSVVLLPDTQYYTDKYPETYLQQTQWIKDQAKARSIRFVIHLGDLVDKPDDRRMWKVADAAHRTLDGVVPYSVLPGNHDMNDHDSTLYNEFFSPRRFAGQPWYGGNEDGTNDNNYCLFEASGMRFLVLSLEYRPTEATLAWAAKVLDRHPDRRVIVATHEYLDKKGRRRPSGEQIWDKVVRRRTNVFLIVCGHVPAVSRAARKTDAGTPVEEMLADCQWLPNGGDGWLRILRFSPAKNRIFVETYSPKLDQTDRRPTETFQLDYPMTEPAAQRPAA